ncbi:butyrophilin subfamily 3 member A2-like isoform X3 [Thunnus thynnus]|uniref:butyrophilin subfamily 3 member A2-like isoform X3 n=1 Tax=Thunnus thynnus TaxID=8237 RepID=UPI0035278B5A
MQQNCRMLFQTNRPSLQSPLKTFCVLVVHLLLTHSCKGQSQLIGSSQPIVATVGDDIILPCHLEPAMDVAAMTLEWTRSDLDPIYIHVWRARQDLIDANHPSYRGRTSLFPDELKQGNISLKLSKVKLSDGGKYKCYIPKLNTQSFVELFVDAASSPVISLTGLDRDRGGVVLQCESKGWYPQPEVFWLDDEGNLLSAGPTETVRGPDDLYTVSSRVTVEKRHNNNFTCRVQQNNINQIRETHIIVPDDFFKVQSSSSTVTVGLVVCIVLIVAAAVFFFGWKWRQNRKSQVNFSASHRV